MFRLISFILLIFISYHGANQSVSEIEMGAERYGEYLPILKNRDVGLLVNHTSFIGNKHLLDVLLSKKVKVSAIFAPEHGFRGEADAGAVIKDGIDSKTGIPVISLYGSNKKPTAEQMKRLDIVIFDIQDVGARFYTYISSMTYMMEACAKNDVQFVVLDRPNPNGDYVDGPVLDMKFKSFVGMHPIPIVHGMTVGELAQMINEEGWLQGGAKCDLRVVPMVNYTHNTHYKLPIKPSPNLPNYQSVRLYPSVCLIEGTTLSLGRGTEFPFQVIGYPDPEMGDFSFTPVSRAGASKPKLMNEECFGVDLRNEDMDIGFNINYVIEFYEKMKDKDKFFNAYFKKLAGNSKLEKQIMAGTSEEEIRKSWVPDLEQFKLHRKKYLLYPDFK